MKHPLFLGVDAGGTRTRAVLLSAQGEILGRGEAGGANFRTGVRETAKRSLQSALGQAVGNASTDIAALCIGSAGLEAPGSDEQARALLGNHVRPERIIFDTDAYVAWAGALALEPGILVISGTGSICLGVDAFGHRVRAGGWGWRFGDEGSAYAVAEAGIRAALLEADGRSSDTRLWRALKEFTKARDEPEEEVKSWLYAQERTPAEIARFALYVEQAAYEGSETAKAILVRSGQALAGLVHAVASLLELAAPTLVSTAGSVLKNNAQVREAFLETLDDLGEYHLRKPRYPPEIGAALLAMRAFDPRLADQALAHLQPA